MPKNKRRKIQKREPQLTAPASSSAGTSTSFNKNENYIFDESRPRFRDAVKWSGFVDRSLLIKELLSDPTYVMIFAPRRFGKSMNVDMVKRFFEIEKGRKVSEDPKDLNHLKITENYKAFHRYEMNKPCNIMNEVDLVEQHFGRHPVVHLSFKNVQVSSIQDVENSIKLMLHKAYLQHTYLIKGEIFSNRIKNKCAIEMCTLWCSASGYKNESAIEALQSLIEYLHSYHDRQVYLLVDEIDAPAINALLGKTNLDEVNKISSEVTRLLGAVVKQDTSSGHLLGALITGVSHLGGIEISGYLNNIPVYKWLLNHKGRFAPYYGLGEDELLKLLKDVFPTDDQKQISIQNEVKEFYNGYTFNNKNLYCLWSVLFYIRERSTLDASQFAKKSFWGGTNAIISTLGSLLRDSSFLDQIMKLMNIKSDGCISFTPCKKVRAEDLAELLNNDRCTISNDVVLSFFMEQGYLTPCQPGNVSSRNICVKIPNLDVLVAFHKMFESYFVYDCKFHSVLMQQCADIFKDLPTERNDEIFKEKLEELYNHLQELLRQFNGLKDVNERSLQALLYTIMLKVGFQECSIEKTVSVGSKYDKIDQWLLGDTFACIFEEKVVKSVMGATEYKESAQDALEEILNGGKNKKVPYVKILDQHPQIQNYVLIGICMTSKGEPFMCCLVNSTDTKDCILFPEND